MKKIFEQYLNKEFLLSNKDKIIKIILIILLLIAALIAYALGLGNEKGDEIKIESEEVASVKVTEPIETEMIVVDVGGAVKEPKVVELKVDSRVIDAVNAAGGLAENADTSLINQAAFLSDGEKVYIPKIGEDVSNVNIESGSSAGISTTSGKIDLNTATSEELQTLNGVGPATAEKIIQYRSEVGYFKSIEELKNVNGIGDKTFDNLKEYIKI